MDRPEQIKFAPRTYGHSSACDLQIIFAPGTYGHCLRWLLDRFSPETKFKNIDSPWHQNGSVHYTFPDDMYSSKFCLGHQLNGSWGELTENVGHAMYNTTSAVNNIKLAPESGNITSGTFILYGVTP